MTDSFSSPFSAPDQATAPAEPQVDSGLAELEQKLAAALAEAEKLRIRPWQIAIEGEVDKPFVIGIDDLLKKVTLEERIYRHRCVEAWSMVVPWSGFPLKALIELAKPKAGVKYVRFETFNDPEMASGQQPGLFGSMPWPYIEGLTQVKVVTDQPDRLVLDVR